MHKTNIILSVATAFSLCCVLTAQTVQQAYLKASNTDGFDQFGTSVSLSGDTMVVGARYEDSQATGVNGVQSDNGARSAGAAYVFVRSGGAWAQQAYLKASNTDGVDNFGACVSISGDTVVVGAPGEDSNATGVNGDQSNNSAGNAGAAYVFVRSAGVWTQQAYLKASNTDASDLFGWSVAVSGDTLVVGAIYESSNATGVNGVQSDNSASFAGAAYVFVRSAGVWTQQAYLKASNTDARDYFGQSVRISGDTVVVGAYFESSNAMGVNGDQSDNSARSAGAAYVFVRSGTTWTQQAYLKASNTDAGDIFGYSVSISDDTVVIGADQESSNAMGVNGDQSDNSARSAGAAYVFVRSAGVWTQQAYLKASNTDADDQFGHSAVVSGATVVVGAWREGSKTTGVNGVQKDNSANGAGAAYVFVNSGSTWTQQAYLKASNTDASDQFGTSATISGTTVVVGAVQEASNARGINGDQTDNSVAGAGAAYVFLTRKRTSASYSTFGSGCAAASTPTALSTTTLPKLGSTFNLRLSNLGPLAPGILLFGVSDTTWSGIPLPLDLTFLGMKGCKLLVSWDLEVNFTSPRAGGSLDFPIPIPANSSLEGVTFYNQAWVIDAKANAFGVGTSNGGKGVIGY
jgi:hypothetical protein